MTTSRSTVLDRLVQAGITGARARDHPHDGWVLVDGHQVEDPASLVTPPSTVELRAIRRTE
ncbi:hypothetical protein [Pseudonocardia abyssalis]|jgi:hypothetical protein|uniref:RNA-binding S4 domain-containing protein n=1 Tax=Pseudonocardia abyssalis TaxID=2792008 RepID=A0ABS6UNR7_9PSEU|nr:hypothetical protein [Pseudonocardia abyssalis]MBW0117471.1 hypothetical protein [Pseudonocardia abyssalis]MBW0133543.1 hypothetical protein [Pseudonocardia abyssalis]